jgi:hypothetical protein
MTDDPERAGEAPKSGEAEFERVGVRKFAAMGDWPKPFAVKCASPADVGEMKPRAALTCTCGEYEIKYSFNSSLGGSTHLPCRRRR